MKNENLPKYCVRKLTPKQRREGAKLGTLYFYRTGEPSLKFECQNPSDPEFQLEYALLLQGNKQRELHNPHRGRRTFNALVRSFIQTPQYAALSHNTAKDYDKAFKYFTETFGEQNPTKFKRQHIIQMRDANRERMRFANYTVQCIRILFEHARDLGWMDYNPARGVKLLVSNNPERLPWPDYFIKAYREIARNRELLLFEMCLATGQRIGDVLEMKWTDIRPIDGTVGVDLVQNKTGKGLWIPLRDSLVTLLKNTKHRNEYILTNRDATGPWSYRGASQAVMKIRKQIGADKFDIHSLRYSAACELALAGLDDDTIGAVTGQTKQTVQHYTKSVRQMANARRAIKARELWLENRA